MVIRRLSISLLLMAALVMALAPTGTRADGTPNGVFSPGGTIPRVSVNVTSGQNGVSVQLRSEETVPGQSGAAAIPVANSSSRNWAPGASASANGSRSWSDFAGIHVWTPDGQRVDLTPLTIPVDAWSAPWDRAGATSHPNATPYLVFQNGVYAGIVWLGPGATQAGLPAGAVAVTGTASPPIDPRQVALSLVRQIPLPDLQVSENPSLGLVGLPSWFWVSGYDGQAFGDSASLPGVTVSVRVWPDRYTWSFGDGVGLTTLSLGKPYPQQSDIQHTYQYSSLRAPGGFPVRLTVEYAAEYRVNGGPPQALPPLQRTYEAGYPVQEEQAVLTGP